MALGWRATAQSAALGFDDAYRIPRLTVACLFAAWALVYFAHVVKPASTFFSRLVQKTNANATLILCVWSTLSASFDVLAGAEPLVLAAGLTVASMYGWDRPHRNALTGALACLFVAGVSVASSILDGRSLDYESLNLIAVSLSLTLTIPFAIRSYIAPSRDQLRTLEMENRQLWELSFKDALTGLYNRRFAQETGRALFQRARRYREDFHVLMIDVDRFKRINDELSHSRGDEVLKAIASIIQSCLRSSDSVARYGGEEFLVFLVRSDSQVAQFVADRIRATIEATSFPGVPWTVTISVGVAGIKDDDSLESLIDRADRFVYSSKRGGRNRVSGY